MLNEVEKFLLSKNGLKLSIVSEGLKEYPETVMGKVRFKQN